MISSETTRKLNFKGKELFLDGKPILVVPGDNDTVTRINQAGVLGRTIFVGTGSCCFGYALKLVDYQHKPHALESIFTPDLNVHEMLPVSVDYEKAKFPNDGGLLVAGYGCAGSGVRLLSTYSPKSVDVVTTEEFSKMMGRDHCKPFLRVDAEAGKISLDLLKAGYRVKAGMQRDPKMPSILVDTSVEEWHVSQNRMASKDLTPILTNLGVNIEETIALCKDYTRIEK